MAEQDEWLSRWEQECSDSVEQNESSIETQILSERDNAAQKLFVLFQNSATSVAQLYKERQHGVKLWTSFQNAASTVTSLYKECVETQKRQQELSLQCGQQRRNKDLIAWARKKKRHIRREDLISYLSGRTLNPRLSPPLTDRSRGSAQWGSPRRYDLQRSLTRLNLSTAGASAPGAAMSDDSSSNVVGQDDDDLGTFRQALALSALTASALGSTSATAAHAPHPATTRASRIADLNLFIAEEFARHGRKRHNPLSHGSPMRDVEDNDDEDDMIMDSPSHKRTKYV